MKEELLNEPDFLQNLLDAVPSFLFIVDSDLKVHNLNSSAKKLLEADKSAVFLKRSGEILDCIHAHETPEGCGGAPTCKYCVLRSSVVEALNGTKVYRRLAEMTFLSGGRARDISLSITASPFDYMGRIFTLLVLEDVTNEKKLEEELREYAAKLETSYKDLEIFSLSASHDLRAPLRAIGAYSGFLLEDAAGKLEDDGKGLLNNIIKNVVRMERLIDDLLDFSRAGTREIQSVELDMETLVKEAFEELGTGIGDKGVRLWIGALPRAAGDIAMMRQVFVNLLSNALKFSRNVQTPMIEVGGEVSGDESIYFVRDNGVGFDMKHADKLFGYFIRLHAPGEFEGTGLGLSIIKKIVEKHGGRVWAESKPDEGATFYFALPRKSPRDADENIK